MSGLIKCCDCLDEAKAWRNSAQLMYNDCPFNIGFKYDNYNDNLPRAEYIEWLRKWLSAAYDILTHDGSLWANINDASAAELKIAAESVGFHLRRWCLWKFTFGQNQRNNFTNSHTHLFYFVKDKKKFTFNADDPACRVPSARQVIYGDKRANPKGKLPDDVWEFPRICGTFKERNKSQHGCQIPEALLARIIRVCSNPTDTVADLFCGTGSTLVVAKKLGRNYLGCDISPVYVSEAKKRIESVAVGDKILGE